MKNKIQYICSECNHVEFKEKSWKKRIKNSSIFTLKVIIGVFTMIGILAVYNTSIDNNYLTWNHQLTMGGLGSFFMNNFGQIGVNKSNSKEFLIIAENLSKGCSTNTCKSKKIYNYITQNFVYEVGSDMNPMDIWRDKSGDCDELSLLYLTLLREINIDSYTQCNSNHCWNIIHTDEKTIVVDLVNSYWEIEDG